MDSEKNAADNSGALHGSHTNVGKEWTEVRDFGDIHNLYAVMDFAVGDRMERFDVRGDELVKLYTMVYRVDYKWFYTAFRIATLLYSQVFEVQTIEIISGKRTKTVESETIHRRIIYLLDM